MIGEFLHKSLKEHGNLIFLNIGALNRPRCHLALINWVNNPNWKVIYFVQLEFGRFVVCMCTCTCTVSNGYARVIVLLYKIL